MAGLTEIVRPPFHHGQILPINGLFLSILEESLYFELYIIWKKNLGGGGIF